MRNVSASSFCCLTDNEDMTIWIDTANPPWLGHPLVHLIFRPSYIASDENVIAQYLLEDLPKSLLLKGKERECFDAAYANNSSFCISVAVPESVGRQHPGLVSWTSRPLCSVWSPALYLLVNSKCTKMHACILSGITHAGWASGENHWPWYVWAQQKKKNQSTQRIKLE